ncbi:MAG: 50S ribosomal protein L15 [Salinivirgaceae bacterium]|nr:50S ribosomal protein L15 [Salinivirgaceae bacterium]
MNDLIKPKKGSTKKRLRRGRGDSSGLGGESGRGHKGQQSRSGYSKRFGFEGGQMPLYKRVPKKKGFKILNKIEYEIINLDQIELISKNGDIVDVNYLFENRLLKSLHQKVKILGNGTLTKKITFKVYACSKQAAEKIVKTGSTIEIVK